MTEKNDTKFYPIAVEYVGPNPDSMAPHLLSRIRILDEPGITNMSCERVITGSLGTTGDWSKTALGEFDADGARALLIEHGVQIPNDVTVRFDDYSFGDETSESYNKQFAYI